MTPQHIGRLRLALLPAAAVLLVACAATPTSTPALDQARALYAQAAADPNAARSAPLELRRAQEALSRAETALKAGEDMTAVEHHAYVARQRASTALQAADIARSEQAVASSAGQRDRILMDARSREAEQRAAEAQKARELAEQSRLQAEKDRALAERARMDAQKATADAEQARQSAEAQLAAAQAAQAKAAKLQAQLAELQAQQTDRGMVLTLGDVLFDTGRAELKDGALRTVDQLVAFLKDNPERTLAIEGYTDSVGSEVYNRGLSLQRADAVKAALTQRGVDAGRITTQGLGEASPVASNTTAEGRQRNRRVEIVISHTR
jgi:outer membrane protein OmpA-like peptidoglycan-associated protein